MGYTPVFMQSTFFVLKEGGYLASHSLELCDYSPEEIFMDKLILAAIVVSIAAISLFVILALRQYLRDRHPANGRGARLGRWFNLYQPFLLAFFMILFLACVIGSTFHYAPRFLPFPFSSPGDDIVPLFNVTAIITGIAFFLTQFLLFYFSWRFRTKPGRAARFIPENLKLEFVWTIIPAVTFLFLFLWGQKLWAKLIDRPDESALSIEIVAEQFNWKVRYPGQDGQLGESGFRFVSQTNKMGVDEHDPHSQDDFVPVQMHVPKGRQIELRLWSKDVIHSFYVPYFRTKMDALPGMITTTHFTATATTDEMRTRLKDPDFNYEVACAELCGRMHFAMKLILVVDEPEDFTRWARHQTSLTMNSAQKKEK